MSTIAEIRLDLLTAAERAQKRIVANEDDLRVIAKDLSTACAYAAASADTMFGKTGLIIPAVLNMFEITNDELMSERRDRSIVQGRQVAMYLYRRYSGKSLQEIGNVFRRDHTTILHAAREVERRMAKDEFLAGQIRLIEKSIGTAAKAERAA
jgi:chromosomal replication initiation ATPase DnaA